MEETQRAGFRHIYQDSKTGSKRAGWYICWKHACFFIQYGTVYLIAEITLILSLFILIVGIYSYYYHNKIIPNTTVGTESASNLTVRELEKRLENRLENYKQKHPFILIQKNETFIPWLEELGVTINIEKTVDAAYENGHTGSLEKKFLENIVTLMRGKNIPLQYSLDNEQFTQYIERLKQRYERDVENASIVIKDKNVSIQNEQNGKKLNAAEIELTLRDSIEKLVATTLEIPIVDVAPGIKSDYLLPTRNLTKTIISKPVNLYYEQNTYSIAEEQIIHWLGFREFRPDQENADTIPQGSKKYVEVYLKNNDIIAYLENEIAKNIDQEPKQTKVITSTTKKQVLEEGQTGKRLDILKTLSLIQQELLKNEERHVELPVEIVSSEEIQDDIPEPRYGDKKHIIVSLDKQLAFAYEGRDLMFVTKVSTGVAGHQTPKGEYAIYAKVAKQKMSGPGYYLPNVPWILWYYGDYSLHGTYWHNNFGTPMSHGCTNLSIDDAKWFYNWADVGTPVINID